MLVLTRKPGQAITIGDEIELIVVEVKGDQVRLGITAPRNVSVHRKEVYEQVCQENMQAAAMDVEAPQKLTEILKNRVLKPKPKKSA